MALRMGKTLEARTMPGPGGDRGDGSESSDPLNLGHGRVPGALQLGWRRVMVPGSLFTLLESHLPPLAQPLPRCESHFLSWTGAESLGGPGEATITAIESQDCTGFT
jgi:hypothetical protein